MSATYYTDNLILNWMRGNAPATPAAIYLAALTAAPNLKTPTVTEVSAAGTAYARQALPLGVPANGVSVNSAAVNFPIATASWGTVTHMAIFDAATAGNCLCVFPLSTSQAVGIGNQLAFDTGTNTITVTVD
jgi:hypothetical protein